MQKVALVTGSSRGIGAACAIELAKRGYRVAIHFRSQEEQALKVQAQAPGSEIFQADLGNPEECQTLVKVVTDKLGKIDVLVNNAGVAIDQLVTFAKPEDFSTSIDTNLRPVFLLTKLVSRSMIRQKSGSIINMTSVVGHTGNKGQSIYAATKAGITGFTKSIASDLAPFGIRCNCVAPGFIATDMTQALPDDVKTALLSKIPLNRLGQGEEVAKAVAFLASADSSYITGTTIHVNGGMFTS